MLTRAVIAHYWINYHERSEAFESIPAAFEFLRRQALVPGVVIDKVALNCGTVVLSRGDIEQLNRANRTRHADQERHAQRETAVSKSKTAPVPRYGFSASFLSWAASR